MLNVTPINALCDKRCDRLGESESGHLNYSLLLLLNESRANGHNWGWKLNRLGYESRTLTTTPLRSSLSPVESAYRYHRRRRRRHHRQRHSLLI